MSVLVPNRKESGFQVFHNLEVLRKEITDLLLRDFGYDTAKQARKLERQFGGRPYEELAGPEKLRYERLLDQWAAFDEWFIQDERKYIIDCLRGITKHVYMANSIFPIYQEELIERRIHQDQAIGLCYDLIQELQYAIETLPVDVNVFLRFSKRIQTEINLIKSWRKSDNKKRSVVISDSATNFANANNNGNANNNNASNSNGVRPDFTTAASSR